MGGARLDERDEDGDKSRPYGAALVRHGSCVRIQYQTYEEKSLPSVRSLLSEHLGDQMRRKGCCPRRSTC